MRQILLSGVLGIMGVLGVVAFVTYEPPKNPDPNHTHTDFAVWVNGQQLDFSDARYMSSVPVPAYIPFVERVSAHNGVDDEHEETTIPGREYLHLHDGNGHVIHRHKPGLTIGDFFASIGLPMADQCLTLDEFQYGKLDAGWKDSYALTPKLCTNGKFHWRMYVIHPDGSSSESGLDAYYVPQDEDQILLTYDAGDVHDAELEMMTNDACLYSKTCPWRGEPPAENCLADPAIPCVIPE